MNDINFGSSRNSFAVKWKSNEYLQLDVKRSLFLFSAFCNGDMHLKLAPIYLSSFLLFLTPTKGKVLLHNLSGFTLPIPLFYA